MLKTPVQYLAAINKYSKTAKGRATMRRYRESPEGRAALAAARKRYLESPKGQAAQARAQLKARVEYAAKRAAAIGAYALDQRAREARRSRIERGLPPELPPSTDRRRGFTETSDPAKMTPAYIAAALALEDLL